MLKIIYFKRLKVKLQTATQQGFPGPHSFPGTYHSSSHFFIWIAGSPVSPTKASFQPGLADSNPHSSLIHDSKDPGLSIISEKCGQPVLGP